MASPRKWYTVDEFGGTTQDPDQLITAFIAAQNSKKCLEMDLGGGENGDRAVLLPSGKFLIVEAAAQR